MGQQRGTGSLRQYSGLALLSTIGITMGMCLVIGVGGGWLVQKQWPNTAPWGVLVGILLGLGAGFREMIRVLMQASKESEETDGE